MPPRRPLPINPEAASGMLLVGCALVAIVFVNSGLAEIYRAALDAHLAVGFGDFKIDKPLHLWINDGLMAIFFLLVGLEIKREALYGRLSSRERAALPVLAAAGGMAAPALVYVGFNLGSPETLRGWAIPAATDIAFALGVLALVGPRVPRSLKIFLMALAVIDDLGAIVIIAAFYTADLALAPLAVAGGCVAVLAAMNRLGVRRIPWYLLVGAVLWVAVLKSGVHATLAGVALALAIPADCAHGERESPLKHLEHAIAGWVNFAIMPIFAFANAGIELAGMTADDMVAPVPLGIAAGLFLGKQAGVMGAVWLAIRTRVAQMPQGTTWTDIYGVALLTGIGFTMSLFIGMLAFSDPQHANAVRFGVLSGSLASAVLGFAWLRRLPVREGEAEAEAH
ncbi:sodium-proton antiporter [uncultured Alphaproteobacteria bacterium]|uniref:Na(+)/H(+) antiporter NhaA n=1 Tax=uncultured Alphaproteobacteria bacterium TaxID=91750 RepID=A0A212JL82_9PROT|nr:sodium-proton antiporter [uncultured Alphaproteobacteria bacterium]